MNKLKFKKLGNYAILPERGSKLSSGVDLTAAKFIKYYGKNQSNIEVPDTITKIHLNPLDRVLVGTNLSVDLEEGYEMQIRPRSGRALKEGLTVLNTPGTIDADYHNEIGVILVNLSPDISTIVIGERIAQAVISKIEILDSEWVEELTGEDRGGGFGHTGN